MATRQVLKNTMTLTPLTPAEHSQNNIQDLKTEFSDSGRSNSNTLGFDLSTLRQSDRQTVPKVEPKK
jgi:hypothetical protein